MKTKKKNKTFGVVNEPVATISPEEQAKNQEVAKLKKDFTEFLYYQRKQKANLLGNFVDGQYDIRDENILQALMKLPKKYENTEGDSVYVSTKLDDFVLNFRIDLDISYSYCDARIWLIEIEQTATEDIKHTTQLDRVVEIYSQDFRKRLFENWKIYYDDEQIVKDSFLYQLLRMQREEYLFSKELVSILSQLYILRMLKFLEGFGELGEKIQIDFRKAMEERINADPSVSIDFTLQKEILDNILIKHDAVEQILKDKQGAEIVEGFTKPLAKIQSKSFETITENTRKTEKVAKKEDKAPTPVVKKKAGATATVTKPTPKIDYSKIFNGEFHPGSAPTVTRPLPQFEPAQPRTLERVQPAPPVQPTPTTPSPQPVPASPSQPEAPSPEESQEMLNLMERINNGANDAINANKNPDTLNMPSLTEGANVAREMNNA